MAQAYSKRQSFPKWSQLLPCKWKANCGHMSSIWQAQVKVFESTAYTLLKIWYKQSCKHPETSYCKSPSVSTPFSTPEGPLKKKRPKFRVPYFPVMPTFLVRFAMADKRWSQQQVLSTVRAPEAAGVDTYTKVPKKRVFFFGGGGWELWCLNLFWKGGLLTDKVFVLDGLFGGVFSHVMFLRLFFLIWFYLQREWIQK